MNVKWLTSTGLIWTHYLQMFTSAYNHFASPALNGLSPFQLTYGRHPNILLEIKTNPQEGTSVTFKEHYDLLRKGFAYFQKIVQGIDCNSWI